MFDFFCNTTWHVPGRSPELKLTWAGRQHLFQPGSSPSNCRGAHHAPAGKPLTGWTVYNIPLDPSDLGKLHFMGRPSGIQPPVRKSKAAIWSSDLQSFYGENLPDSVLEARPDEADLAAAQQQAEAGGFPWLCSHPQPYLCTVNPLTLVRHAVASWWVCFKACLARWRQHAGCQRNRLCSRVITSGSSKSDCGPQRLSPCKELQSTKKLQPGSRLLRRSTAISSNKHLPDVKSAQPSNLPGASTHLFSLMQLVMVHMQACSRRPRTMPRALSSSQPRRLRRLPAVGPRPPQPTSARLPA